MPVVFKVVSTVVRSIDVSCGRITAVHTNRGTIHPKAVVTGGVLAEECGQLMTDFFKKKRPIKNKEK